MAAVPPPCIAVTSSARPADGQRRISLGLVVQLALAPEGCSLSHFGTAIFDQVSLTVYPASSSSGYSRGFGEADDRSVRGVRGVGGDVSALDRIGGGSCSSSSSSPNCHATSECIYRLTRSPSHSPDHHRYPRLRPSSPLELLPPLRIGGLRGHHGRPPRLAQQSSARLAGWKVLGVIWAEEREMQSLSPQTGLPRVHRLT